jgi:hypothetical protein
VEVSEQIEVKKVYITECFTSRAGTSAKIRKGRTMHPKRRAGTRAKGDGAWRLFRKPKIEATKKEPKKQKGRA